MWEREFTGRHAAMLFVGFFGVIIAVNLFMAYSALSTFPGLEARNGYVASQTFDLRRKAQEALGWTVRADDVDGKLRLSFTGRDGQPVEVASLKVKVGRPTEAKDDFEPDFQFDGAAYVAPARLGPGRWTMWIEAEARDGTHFSQRRSVHIIR